MRSNRLCLHFSTMNKTKQDCSNADNGKTNQSTTDTESKSSRTSIKPAKLTTESPTVTSKLKSPTKVESGAKRSAGNSKAGISEHCPSISNGTDKVGEDFEGIATDKPVGENGIEDLERTQDDEVKDNTENVNGESKSEEKCDTADEGNDAKDTPDNGKPVIEDAEDCINELIGEKKAIANSKDSETVSCVSADDKSVGNNGISDSKTRNRIEICSARSDQKKMPIKEPDKDYTTGSAVEMVGKDSENKTQKSEDKAYANESPEIVDEDVVDGKKLASENMDEDDDKSAAVKGDAKEEQGEQSFVDRSVSESEKKTELAAMKEKDTTSVEMESEQVVAEYLEGKSDSVAKEETSDDKGVASEMVKDCGDPMEVDKQVPNNSDEKSGNNSKENAEEIENEKNCACDKKVGDNPVVAENKVENTAEPKSAVDSLINLDIKKHVATGSMFKKGQKLDQLLSKITDKAKSADQCGSGIPRQAKARKSCAPVNPLPVVVKSGNLSAKAGLTGLTFNIKELEKQGVLDCPKQSKTKQSKRKAFEPVKIPSPDKTLVTSPVRSPVRSPIRSPGKSENILKKFKRHKRKKAKRMGGYRLPGEKRRNKNRKTDSEERDTSKLKVAKISNVPGDSTNRIGDDSSNIEVNGNERMVSAVKLIVERDTDTKTMSARTASKYSGNKGGHHAARVVATSNSGIINTDSVAEGEVADSQGNFNNAFNTIKKNSKKAFASPANSTSLTKKVTTKLRQGIDPATHRSLESFLMSGSHSQNMASGKKSSDKDRTTAPETTRSEHRKRKASEPMKIVQQSTEVPMATWEEKKRRVEREQTPQTTVPKQSQMITLLPTGSPPLGMPIVNATHPVIPVSANGNPPPIILAPGPGNSGQQTIIQNGTLNGLPMFQIVNNLNQNIATSQTAQFVAIAQSQSRSLLTNTFSKSQTLIPQKGMPLLLTPVQFTNTAATVSSGSQPHILTSAANIVTSLAKPLLGKQHLIQHSNTSPASTTHSKQKQQHSVLKQTLNAKHTGHVGSRMHLANGQLDVTKLLQKDSVSGALNGLCPVIPPRTPEEHQSETSSHEMDEIETGASLSVRPEKDVIPLCTCKISGASFQKMSSAVTFCQALDSVDGKVLGCCNKVTNPQLVRPAVKIPFLAVCESHRKRLRLHQCCPGCGHYCTQGRFLHCTKENSSFVHHFHEQCQVTRSGKNHCPHCGEVSQHYEVHLTMPENTKNSIAPKESKPNRTQCKARIGLADRRSMSAELVEAEEEPPVTHTLDKLKKTISTSELPLGPDRYSLERVLSCLSGERAKKYRHLPKCLYTPAYDNDLERVIYMLEDGHNANEGYEDLDGQSALHAAAVIGSLCIVHTLVQAGASPHLQDKYLKTPLMLAAENNHADVVNYLLKANATIDAKADDGMTALHYAAKAGHLNIITVLLDTDRLNINVTDDGGWTPLIWAAEHMEVGAVKLLLKRKADPNLRDNEENTTMHWAAFSGSVSIAEQLLAAGCDLDSLNMHGDRPLHIACRQDHYDCVVLFLARGADVEAKNNKGESPLECCLDQTSPTYLALKVNKQLKGFGAKHMGRPEKLLHRDLSKGRENIPIPCVNGVDDEGIPTDYLYVTDNIETTCLRINRVIGSLQKCQCKDDCSSIYCNCGRNSLKCWYDKYGRLLPEFNMQEPPFLFECNRACDCWTTCNNRVVQNGVMSRLLVFKTEGRGWGCKTLVDITRGTFICEYIGEHISDSEADRREDDSYLFDLDNRDGETYCIDARKYGNVARFINHLCQPNLVSVKVFVDSQDLRFPRICLFASRDIKAQEELGFDYGEKFWIIKWKQFTCTCASPKCRYSKDTIQNTLTEYRQRHELDADDPIE